MDVDVLVEFDYIECVNGSVLRWVGNVPILVFESMLWMGCE